jgi:hypothetical protein
MKKFLHLLFATLAVINLGWLQACASDGDKNKKAAVSTKVADDAGLKLPGGFSAVVVADNLGKARHIVVTKQGDVYAKINARGKEKAL